MESEVLFSTFSQENVKGNGVIKFLPWKDQVNRIFFRGDSIESIE